MNLDASLLVRAMPGCTNVRAQLWAPPLAQAMTFYSIDTPQRLADFIAQIGHESQGLLYSAELWGPSQVPEQVTYERDPLQPWGPQLVRGQRNFKAWTLGNSQQGDGYRFRGRGPIQRTGRKAAGELRDNLRARGLVGVPDFEASPQFMELPQWGSYSAGDFWHTRGLNSFSDLGTEGAFVDQTKRINGGTNGLPDRKRRRQVAREVLGVSAA